MRKYSYFVVGTLMFCAVLTMAYIMLPLRVWKQQLPEGWSFLISDYHITFQQRFHHDVYHNQAVTIWDQLIICLQYSIMTFQSFSRIFFIIGLLFYFMPLIQGIIYTMLPDWASELPGKIIECLSGDESEPPELEIDPGATTFATICSRNVSSNSLTNKGSNGASEKRFRIRATPALNIDTTTGRNGDTYRPSTATTSSHTNSPVRHVFDPVFGVIPEYVRDRWSSSSLLDNNSNRKNSSSSAGTSSSDGSQRLSLSGEETAVSESTVETVGNTDKKNIGIRVSRVLPPVRYSLSPTAQPQPQEITQRQGLAPEIEQNAMD